jgi:hypothetical protein
MVIVAYSLLVQRAAFKIASNKVLAVCIAFAEA